MKYFNGKGLGRVIILELERGENIIESIEGVLAKEDIKNAYIASGIGSIRHLEYHRPTTMEEITVDEYLSYDEPFELGCISGTIIDGKTHLHFSAASKDSIQIGHLEKGTEVLYLVEITIVELTGYQLTRQMTKEKVNKLFSVET